MAEPRDRTEYLPPYDPKDPPQGPPKDVGAGGSNNQPTNLGTLNVPTNIYTLVQSSAAQYQVPVDVLLAVIYQESNYNPNAKNTKNPGGGIDRGIAQINSKYHPEVTDAQAYDPVFAINMLARETAATYKAMSATQGATKDTWWDAAANWHRAVHDNEWTTYRNVIKNWADNGFAPGPDRNVGDRGNTSPHTDLIGDFDEQTSYELHQVADGVYLKLLGHLPSPAEYVDIRRNGWNEAQLEDFLRSQTYGNSKVDIGTAGDLRAEAHAQAKAVLGRDATEGEIAWLISNNIPSTNVSAYYEQIRDHAVWASDPDTYRAARHRIWQILSQDYGIAVPEHLVDPALVNAAATGKYSDAQIKEAVEKSQAPGQNAGVSIGDVARVDKVAGDIWSQYFPGRTMPDAERKLMIGMSPDQIMAHIRGLPSLENPAIQAGPYYDAKKAVESVYAQMGFVGRMPTSEDITKAVTGKLDREGIWQALASKPDLLAVNPGLPYHMQRPEYLTGRKNIEQSYATLFGKGGEDIGDLQKKIDQPTDNSAASPEPDYIKSIFQQGIGENEARANFADYFKRLGRAPSIEEVNGFKSKVTAQYSDRTVEPAFQDTDLGPTAPLLGGPKKNNLFGVAPG